MKVIETNRLLLRPFTLEDAAALNRVNRNPDVMRYIGKVEEDAAATAAYLQKGPLADYQKHGFGRHACIHKASGELIGFCGLKYLPELDEVDVGYRLLPEYWGQGLAAEGGEAVMAFGKQELGLKRIIGIAMPDNAGSIHLLKKLGLVYEGRIDYLGVDCVKYAWQSAP
ncbi:GNAT family N-acetyltransferase [Aliiglaciecola sp. CAU 1673]|uniref:GNAT family N-acetyltransferase n=1 Tax=Aliiglaciecola sp. CAU 1673 TaxID=3032595 RepID=UPI0023DAD010|nr:GNAT family N-acetyltransferase [Aliiglaciecola sp. CAU 1673]MDF2176861.1 GNAT family N-acetyltransferase [Aliiglaciecola sp. CAU 1673]